MPAAKLTILCPITSRGCSCDRSEQPVFHALIPSLDALGIRDQCKIYFGYDSDDPIWQVQETRRRIPDAEWISLAGLTGKITSIWNALASHTNAQHILPANDDLEFLTSPLAAIETLKARNGFGTCAFDDAAFPGLPTFYAVGRLHFEIFGTLYPVPWQGAHQDPWIADVYRPWNASEIDPRIKVHNRMGSETNPVNIPRFEYGELPDHYEECVMNGRRAVNEYLKGHPGIAEPIDERTLTDTSVLLDRP